MRGANRRFRAVAVHRVYGKMITARQQRENSFDSLEIFAKRPPGNFDLYMGVPVIEELANFISESRDVIGREVVAASGINRHGLPGGGFSDKLAEKTIKRLFRDLGGRVPERHVQGSDRDTTLAVTAGFLAIHHAIPGSKWVEVVARSRGEFIFPSGEKSWRKTLANQSALAKAPDRRKAKACDWRAVSIDIRDDGDRGRIEAVGRNLRIAVARDWNRLLYYVYDPHLKLCAFVVVLGKAFPPLLVFGFHGPVVPVSLVRPVGHSRQPGWHLRFKSNRFWVDVGSVSDCPGRVFSVRSERPKRDFPIRICPDDREFFVTVLFKFPTSGQLDACPTKYGGECSSTTHRPHRGSRRCLPRPNERRENTELSSSAFPMRCGLCHKRILLSTCLIPGTMPPLV